MSKYAKRVDANHGELLAALRACGWDCLDTSAYPSFVDCIGIRRGVVKFFEFKTAKGKLKPSQERLMARFPVVVLRTASDAARVI